MKIVIVSPALADANNGNWRTAHRWTRFLRSSATVRVLSAWPDCQSPDDDVMLALHARRSAASIRAWHQLRGSRGLGVIMTGTDLHQDILASREALASLQYAQTLTVLHERGIAALPEAFRAKAGVILQSATPRARLLKTHRHLNILTVGHLRSEKSPETLFSLAHLLRDEPGIRLSHIGKALEPALAEQATACMRQNPHYRWLGERSHNEVRRAIQRAHLLVHPSRMEGGANVVIEAIASGTAVLASAVAGNIGLLGEDYPGYFPWGDAEALARMLCSMRREQATGDGFLSRLTSAIGERAQLFNPEREKQGIRQLVAELAASR